MKILYDSIRYEGDLNLSMMVLKPKASSMISRSSLPERSSRMSGGTCFNTSISVSIAGSNSCLE